MGEKIALTRIDNSCYNGQSPCRRCNPKGTYSGYINWSCMMIKFKELEGFYCPECAEKMENGDITTEMREEVAVMSDINGVSEEQLNKSIQNISDRLVSNGFIGSIHPDSIEAHKRFIQTVRDQVEDDR